jgi:hypothetical protein
MMGSLNLSFDTTQRMMGILTERYDEPFPKPGDKLRLYIPILMSKIKRSSPNIYVVASACNSIFCNASNCKPNVKSTIKGQNYITVAFARNSTWEGIYRIRKERGRIIKYIERGEKFNCESKSGKLKKLLFDTSGYTV